MSDNESQMPPQLYKLGSAIAVIPTKAISRSKNNNKSVSVSPTKRKRLRTFISKHKPKESLTNILNNTNKNNDDYPGLLGIPYSFSDDTIEYDNNNITTCNKIFNINDNMKLIKSRISIENITSSSDNDSSSINSDNIIYNNDLKKLKINNNDDGRSTEINDNVLPLYPLTPKNNSLIKKDNKSNIESIIKPLEEFEEEGCDLDDIIGYSSNDSFRYSNSISKTNNINKQVLKIPFKNDLSISQVALKNKFNPNNNNNNNNNNYDNRLPSPISSFKIRVSDPLNDTLLEINTRINIMDSDNDIILNEYDLDINNNDRNSNLIKSSKNHLKSYYSGKSTISNSTDISNVTIHSID